MLVLIRTLTYAVLIVGLLAVALPGEVLARAGITQPAAFGLPQILGSATGVTGGVLALWCALALAFAFVGRGTPLPFDPPRRLVVRGPYRFVRNPMAIGVALVIAGAALYYRSIWLLGVTVGFVLVIHLMVLGYEEPTLRRTFGSEYEAYSRRVGRWWPRF